MNDSDPLAKKLVNEAVKQTESRIVDVNAIIRAIHEHYPSASRQEIMGVVLKIIQQNGLAAWWE